MNANINNSCDEDHQDCNNSIKNNPDLAMHHLRQPAEACLPRNRRPYRMLLLVWVLQEPRMVACGSKQGAETKGVCSCFFGVGVVI